MTLAMSLKVASRKAQTSTSCGGFKISMLTGRSCSPSTRLSSQESLVLLGDAEIRRVDGSVAAPPSPKLLPLSGTAVGGGATRAEAQSVLGCLVTSFLFHRELLSGFGHVYKLLRKLRVATRGRLRGTVADEALSCSW